MGVCDRAYADPGVLNRAEWVKFVAVFFNKEVEAEKLFTKITENYEKLNTTVAAAASQKPRPVVAWISKFGDTITVAYANYKKQYVQVGSVTLEQNLIGTALMQTGGSQVVLQVLLAVCVAWCDGMCGMQGIAGLWRFA